ncbi:hypothetical protein ACTHT4_11220 [Neisseria sp. P0022.S007]
MLVAVFLCWVWLLVVLVVVEGFGFVVGVVCGGVGGGGGWVGGWGWGGLWWGRG